MGTESLSSSLGKICHAKWSKPKHYEKCYFNAGGHTIKGNSSMISYPNNLP